MSDIIILSDVYCEISQIAKAHIVRVRCGALTTSGISQYALDNVFIICQCAYVHDSSNHIIVTSQ